MPHEPNFLRELRATFKVEAQDHVQTLSRGLQQLEHLAPTESTPVWETIFRAVHSLKGAARAVDVLDIESLCQTLEDVFAARRGQASAASPELLKALFRASDALETMVADLGGDAGQPPARLIDVPSIRSGLRQASRNGDAPPVKNQAWLGQGSQPGAASPAGSKITPPGPAPAPAPITGPSAPPEVHTPSSVREAAELDAQGTQASSLADETVRVPVPKLEAQLVQSEELLLSKFASGKRLDQMRELSTWFTDWRKAREAIDGDVRALRRHPDAAAARVLEFQKWSDDAAHSLEATISRLSETARNDFQVVIKTVDGVVEGAKRLLMLPFSTISASFPKLVRDLCRAQGKEAELIITGELVEMDKRILEKMKDPLVHMLRNAVDHGIELPSARIKAGKPARAAITLAVSQVKGNSVQIVLSDDGAGIAADRLRAVGVQRGVLSAEAAEELDESAARDLIFQANISTRETVTALSGRGLGLAIVRENVDSVGGALSVESTAGAGTTFTMEFDAIRSTYRGVMVQVGGRFMLVPTANVERVIRIGRDMPRSINGRDTVTLGTRTLPLVSMASILEIAMPAARLANDDYLQIVVVAEGGNAAAFLVDQVIEEQEVLVKPLRKPLLRVRNVAGGAVLGSGEVVPILHVSDLLKSAVAFNRSGQGALAKGYDYAKNAATSERAPRKSVLVAEDSITSRMLLKAVLESAGYLVSTAVDGMDAFSQLRGSHFDLLVSDVEMPRLSGIDLTAKVRSEKKLADLPVILVSALASREDRERGVDVGANAYIVKGGFDQDDLLRAVERLI